MISLIAAMTIGSNVLGNNNQIPWKLSKDMKRFKELTTGKPVIMGRKTYESIGKPLPNRTNIILSKNKQHMDNAPELIVKASIYDAIQKAKDVCPDKEIMIIGGAEIYEQCLPLVDRLYLTYVMKHCHGDTFFPVLYDNLGPYSFNIEKIEYHEKDEKNECPFMFVDFIRMNE